MANKRVGEVRPSQLVTTFGPGSIIDAKNDCLTILDINYWTFNGKEIKDSRFASYMGVNHFQTPPSGDRFNSEDIPVVSFPYYHVCSKTSCGKLFKISEEDKESYRNFGPKCPSCGFPAYPSRFVQICPDGHLDDFDYRAWVHKDTNTKCNKSLKLYSTGNTSSLGDLMVECECGAKRSLQGITSHEQMCSCTGHHPFRPSLIRKKCNRKMQVVQRGASNVYFPVIKSAISIPPYTDRLYVLIDSHRKDLEAYRQLKATNPLLPFEPEDALYNTYFVNECSKEDFLRALKNVESGIKDYISIKKSEYNAILNHADPVNKKSPFIFSAEEDPVPEILKPYISRIIRVNRLREIMCLQGFTRLDAPDPEAEQQVNIVKLNSNNGWLPAVEIHGEGVFIEFDKNTIDTWLKDEGISKFDKIIKKEFIRYSENRGWTVASERGAKYVLMHTFAHMLIKEMGNKSGYSTSAIKERIYSDTDMSGILLYTGSSDKEGSLGGLVELGKNNKIIPLIQSAFNNSLLCTNDPECMLNNLDENLNISACHSCCMISETACENGNRLLHRAFVVPINNHRKAYFNELVKEMCGIE